MTIAEELIGRTRDLGIELWVSDGMLKFRAPRAALSAGLRADLLANKNSIIDVLSGPRYVYAPEVKAIEIPVPFATLWKQLRAGILDVDYTNVTNMVCRFKFPMDLQALERALQNIAQQHNALRCRFSDDEHGLRLVFDRGPKLMTIDLSDLDPSRVHDAVVQAAQDISWQPFSADDCLFRPFMFKLPSAELALGFVVHHCIFDGWSFGQILRCWMLEYAKELGHELRDEQPRVCLQYSDFLHGMANWTKTLNFQRRLAFWRETLRGAMPTRMPPDRVVAPDARSFHRAQHIQIDAVRVRRLSEFAASIGVTLCDVLLAGVVIALQRELKVSDICLRNIWHGRDEPGLFDTLGFLANTVMLRVRVSPANGLIGVARQVHRVAIEAFANQVPSYYLDEILDEMGASGFTQANVQLQQGPGDREREIEAASSMVEAIPIPSPHRTSATPRQLQAHDINLSMVNGAVCGYVVYLESLYDDETIRRFIGGFDDALNDSATSSQQRFAPAS